MTVKKKTTAKRKFIDWDSVEPLYRAGSLSLNDICAQYEADHINSQVWKKTVHHTAIIKKAKAGKWTRNLAKKVLARVKEKLVTNSVTGCDQPGFSDNDIIENAAEAGSNIVIKHRKEINELLAHEAVLLQELINTPQKTHFSSYLGNVTPTNCNLTVSEKATTLKNLAGVRAQRIGLEREAYNLNDPDTDETTRKQMALNEVLNMLPLEVREVIREKAMAKKVGKDA